MQFWENLSPMVRMAVIGGVVLLLGLMGLNFYASSPTVSDVAEHRGIK